MKAQRRFGLAVSWSRITPVFLIDVAVLLLGKRWPQAWQTDHVAWWVGVGIAGVVTIFGAITYRRITVASGLATWVWDWSANPEAPVVTGCTPAIDHRRRFGRDVVGVREYRRQLVAVIAVSGPPEAPSGRHHHRVSTPPPLPVPLIATALRQFDVRLDAIDIVSVQTGRAAEVAEHTASEYSDIVDDHPAASQRSTWLVLRLDPERNVAAVAVRDSVASTLAAAAERLAQQLDGKRCTARPLTADEITEVDAAVLAGLEPAWSRPGWRHLKHFSGYATSFWVSPRDITSETLDRLWLPDTDATVVSIRLTACRDDGVEVSAWVRYQTGARLGKDVRQGLNPLTGRQLAAVRASLPAPVRRSPLTVPARALGDCEEFVLR